MHFCSSNYIHFQFDLKKFNQIYFSLENVWLPWLYVARPPSREKKIRNDAILHDYLEVTTVLLLEHPATSTSILTWKKFSSLFSVLKMCD